MHSLVRKIWIPLLSVILTGCMSSDSEYTEITEQFSFAILDSQHHTPEAIVDGHTDALPGSARDGPLFGDAVSRYWYRADLSADLLGEGRQVIELAYPLFDRVDFWMRGDDGRLMHYRAGALYPFTERVFQVPDIAFPLASGGENLSIAFSIQTSTPLLFRVFLWPRQAWDRYQQNIHLWYGALIGGIAILILYNIILALALRDASYLFYAVYLIGVNLMNLVHAGFLDAYLWPDTPGISARIILPLISASIVFLVLFVNHFLDVRSRFPAWWRASVLICVLVIPPAIPELVGITEWNPITIPYLLVFSHISMWYAIGVAIRGYLDGMRQARFIILGLSIFYGGVLLYELYILQVLPYNRWLPHVLEFGSLVEGLILALALADRVRLFRQEADRANQQIMDARTTLSKQLIQKEEHFRQWSSSVLHDVIANGLLLIKLNLDALTRKARSKDRDSDLAREIREQGEACGTLIHEVRQLSHDLHPHVLTRLGLKAAIESILDRAFSTQGIPWQTSIPDGIDHRLDDEQRITLYRSVQECLTNILKHADARKITLGACARQHGIEIRIQDDGRGFEAAPEDFEGIGLLTIKGRLALFGGTMEIQSQPGKGTLVRLFLPTQTR